MKILVIGAPKSGKTKFINSQIKENPTLKNLDNLPKKYVKRTGLALGRISDYRTDIMFVSHTLEQQYKNKDNDYIISSGPLYAYAHFIVKAKLAASDEKAAALIWPAALLNRMVLDSFWYDNAYYLPYNGNNSDSILIDEAIRQSIKDLGLKDRIKTIDSR